MITLYSYNRCINAHVVRILCGLAIGGLQEGANIISLRHLPWLSEGTGLIISEKDRCLASVKDDLVTNKEMRRLQQSYDRSLQELENDLRITRSEADYLQNQYAILHYKDNIKICKHLIALQVCHISLFFAKIKDINKK